MAKMCPYGGQRSTDTSCKLAQNEQKPNLTCEDSGLGKVATGVPSEET